MRLALHTAENNHVGDIYWTVVKTFNSQVDLGLQAAVSATLASVVQVSEDNSIKWHSVAYTLTDLAQITDGNTSLDCKSRVDEF